MVSNVSPALVQLQDENGNIVFPRLMWKRGDDLRRDLIAMVFFEGEICDVDDVVLNLSDSRRGGARGSVQPHLEQLAESRTWV